MSIHAVRRLCAIVSLLFLVSLSWVPFVTAQDLQIGPTPIATLPSFTPAAPSDSVTGGVFQDQSHNWSVSWDPKVFPYARAIDEENLYLSGVNFIIRVSINPPFTMSLDQTPPLGWINSLLDPNDPVPPLKDAKGQDLYGCTPDRCWGLYNDHGSLFYADARIIPSIDGLFTFLAFPGDEANFNKHVNELQPIIDSINTAGETEPSIVSPSKQQDRQSAQLTAEQKAHDAKLWKAVADDQTEMEKFVAEQLCTNTSVQSTISESISSGNATPSNWYSLHFTDGWGTLLSPMITDLVTANHESYGPPQTDRQTMFQRCTKPSSRQTPHTLDVAPASIKALHQLPRQPLPPRRRKAQRIPVRQQRPRKIPLAMVAHIPIRHMAGRYPGTRQSSLYITTSIKSHKSGL